MHLLCFAAVTVIALLCIVVFSFLISYQVISLITCEITMLSLVCRASLGGVYLKS